jgi:hypothetical protein
MPKTEYVRKNITITKQQEKYIQDSAINLSRFVQKKIDENIKK